MDTSPLDRMTPFVVALSVAIAALSFALGGMQVGLGAVAGGLVSIANFLSLRWIAQQVRANETRAAGMMVLVVAKMAVLGAVMWALMHAHVDVFGLGAGFTSLLLGLVAGGLVTQTGSGEDASSAKRKES